MCKINMWNFLNNASIAAFIGAFIGALFAFILVIIRDRYRRNQIKKLLKSVVSHNLDFAKNKLQVVEKNIVRIKEHDRYNVASYMPFYTQSIKERQFQVLDLLSESEAQALDALIYRMEGINNLLNEVTSNAEKLKMLDENGASEDEISLVREEYTDSLEETKDNLNILKRFARDYVEGNPHKILEIT